MCTREIMNRSLQISETVATVDNPYIIAEMGTNHDRELQTARGLIDAAADAGVDAVKYQIFHGEDIVTDTISPAEYGLDEYYDETSIIQIYDNHLRLPREWFTELVEYANERGIDNIATVSCADCAQFVVDSGVDALKIASMDLTHIQLLERLAMYDLPIILSTGFAHLGEIEEALECLRESGHEQHAILHCVSKYPTDPADLNLRNIRTIGTAFDIPVGFSDHSLSPLTPAVAVAHGASIIEKHFTLSRERSGPDHSFALEPAELARMVRAVELSSKSAGCESIAVPDRANRDRYRRSIVADCAITAGEEITRDRIRFARPGTGIAPAMFEQIEGVVASQNIAAETPIRWSDLV
jgi:N-acetylneuraminate synthase/N,N'-diacetyllegionaminate synthase